MPYAPYTRDERSALQVVEGMGLPKCCEAVILGKRPSRIYRELNRNRTGCVYTGSEAHQLSGQRRLEAKLRPKLDDPALTGEIMRLFKHDLSANQIQADLGYCTLNSRRSRLHHRPFTRVSTRKRQTTPR
jgi:IS30 family transposase